MKRLKRIGRAKYKYEFEVNVCDVRGVPASVSSVAVVWQRSDQRLSTPPAVVEVADRVANFGAKLTNVCTLYGGAKDTFEPKMSSVKIVDYGASGRLGLGAGFGQLGFGSRNLSGQFLGNFGFGCFRLFRGFCGSATCKIGCVSAGFFKTGFVVGTHFGSFLAGFLGFAKINLEAFTPVL